MKIFIRLTFVIPLLIVCAGVCRAQFWNPLAGDDDGIRHGIKRSEIVRLGISAVTIYLDATMIARTEYDSAGRVRFESARETSTEYRYDSLGRVVLVIMHGEIFDDMDNPYRMRISHDAEGRVSEMVAVDENGVETIPGSHIVYRYSGDTISVIERSSLLVDDTLAPYDKTRAGQVEHVVDTTTIITKKDGEGRPLEIGVVRDGVALERSFVVYDPCRSVRSYWELMSEIISIVVDSCARTRETAVEYSGANGEKFRLVSGRALFDEVMRPLRVEMYDDEGRVVRLEIKSYDENGLPASFRTQTFRSRPQMKENVAMPEMIERFEYEYRPAARAVGAKIR
jgi:hypothetical protein